MKTGTTTHYALCRFRNRPDSRCRLLPRCRTCGRVLAFNWGTGLCLDCEQKDKATTAAEEAAAAGRAVQIIDVSEHKPRRIPSKKWRELIKKVWEADPLLCP
ncbi:MAG: hypothetical protein RBT78_14040, partial [Kiritimatiellia bacterium]|nr:hypothetical protein [Kiritimatiellia bacterium]